MYHIIRYLSRHWVMAVLISLLGLSLSPSLLYWLLLEQSRSCSVRVITFAIGELCK